MADIITCCEMAESLFAYGYASLDKPEDVLKSQYMEDYIKEFGADNVVELARAVADSIDHIEYDVFTDGEGCSYNSVKYKNDSSWRVRFKQKDE